MRILALDVGESRIGIAISTLPLNFATPLTTLSCVSQKRDIEAVLGLAMEYSVSHLLVGIPYNPEDGSTTPQAQSILGFLEALRAASAIPVDGWDESFSTLEAEKILQQKGVKPSRQKGRVDAIAAAVILQSYLDTKHNTLPTVLRSSEHSSTQHHRARKEQRQYPRRDEDGRRYRRRPTKHTQPDWNDQV